MISRFENLLTVTFIGTTWFSSRRGREHQTKSSITWGKLIRSSSTLSHVSFYLIWPFPPSLLCNSLSADHFLELSTRPMQAWLTWYEIITKNVFWLLWKPPAHRHRYLSVYKSMSRNDAPRVHRSSCAGGEGEELEISCNWKNKRDTCLKRLLLALPFHIKTCVQWCFLASHPGLYDLGLLGY